jgi:putative transcriptional regulator
LEIQVIEVKLREAMAGYSQKQGGRLTYQQLAEKTGIARTTLEAIGSRPDYNATLSVLDTLCKHLDCDVSELLLYKKDES